jgi:hypothetical protein
VIALFIVDATDENRINYSSMTGEYNTGSFTRCMLSLILFTKYLLDANWIGVNPYNETWFSSFNMTSRTYTRVGSLPEAILPTIPRFIANRKSPVPVWSAPTIVGICTKPDGKTLSCPVVINFCANIYNSTMQASQFMSIKN